MSNKPLIERAITQARQLGQGNLSTTTFYQRFLARALATTQAKYRWSESALAMVEYLSKEDALRSGRFQAVMPEDNHVWMEFERPVRGVSALTFLLFSDRPLLLEVAHSFHLPATGGPRANEDVVSGKIVWALLLFDEQGVITWSMGFCHHDGEEPFVDFIETPFQRCPTGECLKENTADRMCLCDVCVHTLAYWVSWAATAYYLLSGVLQEQIEETGPREIVERSTVKVPRTDKPHKYHEVVREHRYRYITFDACVRKVHRSAPNDGQQGHASSSWLTEALEVDPQSVVYVDHTIGSFIREYRHERYTHMRGQRQAVRAYHKRVPVKLAHLGKIMTRVVASRVPENV